MISHQHKCVFVHIPKTAGQSIELAFLNSLNLDWHERDALLMKHNLNSQKGPPRLAHLTMMEYLEYDYLSSQQFREYFKFSFVRNPWARLVSEYNFSYKKKYAFKEFLFEHFPGPTNDDYQKPKDAYRHIIPQHKYLFDGEGNQLVDFIGRFENLDADFSEICRRVNLPQIPLPRKNSSIVGKNYIERLKNLDLPFISRALKFVEKNFFDQIKHYTRFYDDESRRFVAEYYGMDIALFGYEFGK